MLNRQQVRDVARLFEGLVTDPLEAQRIMEAIQTDPLLAHLADMFCEVDELEPEADPAFVARNRLLARSRFGRLDPTPDMDAIGKGMTVETILEWVDGTKICRIPLKLIPDGEERINLNAEWPAGLIPLSFVLAQFDFVKKRSPVICPPFSLPTAPPSENQIQLNREANQQAKSRKTGVFWSAAADSGPDHSVASGTAASPEIKNFGLLPDGYIVVGNLPQGRDDETVMVETTLAETPNAVLWPPQPVLLKRKGNRGEGKFETSPYLQEAAGKEVRVRVRPLEYRDLPWLSAEQACSLLAVEDFVPLPVNGAGRQRSVQMCYETQRKAVADPQTGWFLRIVCGKEFGDE